MNEKNEYLKKSLELNINSKKNDFNKIKHYFIGKEIKRSYAWREAKSIRYFFNVIFLMFSSLIVYEVFSTNSFINNNIILYTFGLSLFLLLKSAFFIISNSFEYESNFEMIKVFGCAIFYKPIQVFHRKKFNELKSEIENLVFQRNELIFKNLKDSIETFKDTVYHLKFGNS